MRWKKILQIFIDKYFNCLSFNLIILSSEKIRSINLFQIKNKTNFHRFLSSFQVLKIRAEIGCEIVSSRV